MTLPFDNDTSTIVKKLANRSIKANRRRNIFVVITIVIATAMFSTMCLLASGITVSILSKATDFTAAYTKVPEDKVDLLAESPKFDKAGIHCRIPEREIDGNTLNFIYMDEKAVELGNVKIAGDLPEDENEIVVQKEYLKKLGLSASAGDTVSLNLGNGKQDYTITGFAKSPVQSSTVFSVLCSQKFLTENTTPEERNYTVYTFLEMARGYSEQELNELLEGVLADAGLAGTCGILLNDSTAALLLARGLAGIGQNALLFGAVTLLLILASGVVIYNIFMISVRSSIREYGQLRTMGATGKQLKRVVSAEGKLLMYKGIPLGLIISCAIAYFAKPDGFRWYIALTVCLLTFLLMQAAIRISMRTPVRVATKTSPMEALRYGYQKDERIDRKNAKDIHMSPWNLAKVNFKRNRRKTAVIIISMSLCGTSFLIAGSVCASYDVAEKAGQITGNNDFLIYGNSEELEDAVSTIPDVTHTERKYGRNLNWTLPNGKELSEITVCGFSKEEYNSYIFSTLGEKALSYEELVKKDGIIFFHPDWVNYYTPNEPLGFGSKFDLSDPKKQNAHKVTVCGESLLNQEYEMNAWAGIPMELLEKISGSQTAYAIGIDGTKDKWPQIHEAVEELAGKYGTQYLSVIEETEKSEEENLVVYTVLYVIIFLFFLFAIINLINTIITNIVSRQQEFGVLRAVGLSRRQLLRTLYAENGLYVGIALFFSLLLGGTAGYFFVMRISVYGFSYSFPVLEVIALIAFMIISAGIITALAVRIGTRTSIVEQINIAE